MIFLCFCSPVPGHSLRSFRNFTTSSLLAYYLLLCRLASLRSRQSRRLPLIYSKKQLKSRKSTNFYQYVRRQTNPNCNFEVHRQRFVTMRSTFDGHLVAVATWFELDSMWNMPAFSLDSKFRSTAEVTCWNRISRQCLRSLWFFLYSSTFAFLFCIFASTTFCHLCRLRTTPEFARSNFWFHLKRAISNSLSTNLATFTDMFTEFEDSSMKNFPKTPEMMFA